ncbi:MAG: PEP-CTERM sorting domain-containing protein [Pirellulales bacterium]|nr:PEP-CTERM sorting domain-containing protein [Pirellulales bacterium]
MRFSKLFGPVAGIVLVGAILIVPADAALRGLWEFEDSGNLTAATVGVDLALTNPNGSHAAVSGSGTAWDQGAAELGVGDYYTVTHGIAPNGGGSYVNQYTLLMDLSYPAGGVWRCLYQTNTANGNDGDYFIHPSDESWGVGDLGYTDGDPVGTFFSSTDTWYRAVLTFDLGNAIKLYIDGNLVGNHDASSVDGRFSLDPVFLALADNDGEDHLMNIANLAIWDEPLSADAISALGGAGRLIIPEPSSIVLLLLAFAGAIAIRHR